MLPSWLTEEYIQKALQDFLKDPKLRVQKVWAKPATEKGENFVGVMTRVYVDFVQGDGSEQKKSYILKQAAKLFEEYDVYNRELEMYDVVLPKMAKILREADFNEKLMAEAIIVDRERTIMILEDLAPLRYTNADRLVLDMLAKFHASAIILNQREPDLLSRNYESHFFSRGKKGYAEVFVGLFRAFIRYVKTKPTLRTRYADKLEDIIGNLMGYAARSDLQTLVHGDCWTTNVMYLHDDEGNPTTVLPIDFQFSSWTSPVVDLHYFFSTSLKIDVLAKETELVQYHYYALKRTLEALSYKGPRLRAYCKDDGLKVLKIWAKPATGKGENFVGIMTRIHVDYQLDDGSEHKKSFIVKQALPEDVPQAKVFFEYDLYTREMDMYEFLKELLAEAGLEGKLTADAIAVDRQYSTMILEDLAPYMYVNADRVKMLDLAHTKLTVEMLAKFHAAATILRQRHPELLTKEVYLGMFRAFLKFINGHSSLKQSYGAKLEKLIPHIMEYGARVYDVAEGDLQTLNHGDCWSTNIMFQYDEAGIPQTVQLYFTAIDLHYFFTTSLREEVRNKESELVEHHYNALKANLERFSYQGPFPSLQEYQLQFERRRFMSLMAHLFKPFMIYNGSEETSDFSSLYKETPEGLRFQKSVYESEVVLRSATKLLAILDSKGLLDLQ
ncbi:hypothetical protein M5D96_000602 [Drosophila gunungcola]|uniref:CHK kinase-like domain-containing protein n=1 Tax=Drosophila gunungcola TaxID=103775 RepID=A0A9P9YX34_9MUSC|nr:hypothetical protein M5D96_000602 [Drosophila gunungcola]